MENNFFFQFWVNRSLRDFHVVLSVIALGSQVIGAISNNPNIASFGEGIALFTILHFFLHGYFYRQQKFLSDNMRVYSLPKKKIAKTGTFFLTLFLTCICIGMAVIREIYTGSLIGKLKALFLFLLQTIFGAAFKSDGLGKDELLVESNNDLLGVMNQFSSKADSPWERVINNIQTLLIILGVLLLVVLCIWAAITAIRRFFGNLGAGTSVRKTALNTNDQEKRIAQSTASREKIFDFSPVAKMMALGINVSMGTDGVASNDKVDLLGETRLAAMLGKAVCQDTTQMKVADMLYAATMGGAKALGWDDRIGSLEKGKDADLIAVDLGNIDALPVFDPASQLLYSAGREDISHVWVNGKIVVKKQQQEALRPLSRENAQKLTKTWQNRI